MNNVSCEVIRDLLPLYADGVASGESRKLVQEHLETCPACREELDKLRAPVSVPQEEDKEQEIRERLQQSVKELKRARRIKLAAGFAVLATLVLSCLWYTRPQRFIDVVGPWDFTKISVQLTLNDLDSGNSTPEEWGLELEPDGEFDLTMNMFRVALNNTGREYRFPLSSLLHNVFFPNGATMTPNPKGTVRIDLEREDAWVHITACGNSAGTVYIETVEKDTGKSTGRLCYHAGEGLFEILSRLAQDCGEPVLE